MFYSGNLMLIEVKIGERFEKVAGLRSTRVSIQNNLIDASNKNSGEWRELLPSSGLKSVSVSGHGISTNSQVEQVMFTAAFNNMILQYRLHFGNGNILEGKFQIASFDKAGNFNEEENYYLALESSGPITIL